MPHEMPTLAACLTVGMRAAYTARRDAYASGPLNTLVEAYDLISQVNDMPAGSKIPDSVYREFRLGKNKLRGLYFQALFARYESHIMKTRED